MADHCCSCCKAEDRRVLHQILIEGAVNVLTPHDGESAATSSDLESVRTAAEIFLVSEWRNRQSTSAVVIPDWKSPT